MTKQSGSPKKRKETDGARSPSQDRSRLQLAGPEDPFRDDQIERLGPDGLPNGTFSRVKTILSSNRDHTIFEVCDDGNRSLYVTKSGNGWAEVEID